MCQQADLWVYVLNMSRNMTKPTKWHLRPAKTQISLGIRLDWSESSLSAWRKLVLSYPLSAQQRLWSDWRVPRLIWVFAGHIHPVWSESSLSAWRKLGSLATQWAHSEDSDQTGRMPRLIWVFAGRTVILLVLSWGGSYHSKRHIRWICQSLKSILSLRNYGLDFRFSWKNKKKKKKKKRKHRGQMHLKWDIVFWWLISYSWQLL